MITPNFPSEMRILFQVILENCLSLNTNVVTNLGKKSLLLEKTAIFILMSSLDGIGFNVNMAEGLNSAERAEELRPSLGFSDNHSNMLNSLNIEHFLLFKEN